MAQFATYNADRQTLSITHNRETREFACRGFGFQNAAQIAYGVFGVKYRTGNKVWPAYVVLWNDGRCYIEAGGYGRGNRELGAVNVVGWLSDIPESLRSRA